MLDNTSTIANYFISQGVPLETFRFILLLPIIVTLIALLRQLVGIKAFGIYTPSMVTFAFLFMGLKYGIAIYAAVIIIGLLLKTILKHFRMLYLPRVAIMLTIVGLGVLVMLAAGGSFRRTGLAAVSIFPILIMITLVEKFVATQIEKGNRAATILAIETLVISLIGYFIGTWGYLNYLLITYPWIVLLTIPFNIILGRWTGLRLSEYWRFRQILKKNP